MTRSSYRSALLFVYTIFMQTIEDSFYMERILQIFLLADRKSLSIKIWIRNPLAWWFL